MDLSNYSQKNLRLILKMINEEINRKEDFFISKYKQLLQDKMSLINLELIDNDVYSFLIQLYIDNPNYQTEEITVPILNEYIVTTKRTATIDVREFYDNEVSSYLKNEDDLQEMEEYYSVTDWWEGEMVDRDEYNEETMDTEIYQITRV